MRRIVSLGLLLALVSFVVPAFMSQPVYAMTGSGTSGDPYIISDVDDLQAMADDVTYAIDAYYELGNNIDASATTTWNWDGGRGVYEGFLPREFEGHFDGNFYAITDLYIDRYGSSTDVYVGLFETTYYATVKDVLLLGVDISGESTGTLSPTRAGGLVGWVRDYSTIQNIYVSGTVIARCTDTGGIGVTNANAGGIVGHSWHAGVVIEKCATDVSVSGIGLDEAHGRAGGIVGTYKGSGSIIRNCYARGSVSATASRAHSGGLVGWHYENNGSIDNCYSTGVVSGNGYQGGLVAEYDYLTTDCFWDTETSGQSTSEGGTGKTTTEMETESTYTNAGWDFTTVWGMSGYVNDGYPYFQWWYDPTPFAGWTQVLWFEPIDIISGTTLPDRAGTAQNGVITWGANPAGIAIDMGSLVSEGQPPITATPEYPITPVPDMTGESGQPGWTATQPTLPDNPLYPLVEMVGDQMNIPIWLVWVIAALIILLLIMLVSYKYAPHQIITALAGGGWSAFMYSMGIFPFWVMFIFAAMALAVIIGERTPTVS